MATLDQTCDLEMARAALTTLSGSIAIRTNNNDYIIKYRIIQFTPYYAHMHKMCVRTTGHVQLNACCDADNCENKHILFFFQQFSTFSNSIFFKV